MNKDKAAFTLVAAVNQDVVAEGLSKREYFVAAAMQGLCANQKTSSGGDAMASDVAEFAVKVANATLAELEKGDK